MKKNDLAVFKMEREDFKITLKTNHEGAPVLQAYHPAPAAAPAAPAAASASAPAPAAAAPSNFKEIKSPMVGTFYASPSPEAAAYAEVGKPVATDAVVCIIEAMKVMNEIKSEISGTIVEVCAENGKPVQFGQVLFRVK